MRADTVVSGGALTVIPQGISKYHDLNKRWTQPKIKALCYFFDDTLSHRVTDCVNVSDSENTYRYLSSLPGLHAGHRVRFPAAYRYWQSAIVPSGLSGASVCLWSCDRGLASPA